MSARPCEILGPTLRPSRRPTPESEQIRMMLAALQKEQLKRELVACLVTEEEIQKIVIFGSFLTAPDPHDLDVAIFQRSQESYLPLALKYRRKTRAIARKIPIDLIPIRSDAGANVFMDEIARGEVIFER